MLYYPFQYTASHQQKENEPWEIHSGAEVTTIYSALLLFIHHWYIVFWWNNWKNYPCYSLRCSTRTLILAWKTRKWEWGTLEGRALDCTDLPSACRHLLPIEGQPARVPTCTCWRSPDSQPHEERSPIPPPRSVTPPPPAFSLWVTPPFKHTEH